MELSKGTLRYQPDFIEDADEVLEELKKIRWDPPHLTQVLTPAGMKDIPRDQAAFADAGVRAYYFAGQQAKHGPMPPVILKLRKRLRELTGKDYNYALVNHYADGSKYIGPHHDSRKGLVEGSSVVGISFGATRKLQIVPAGKDVEELKPLSMDVEHNSMFEFDWDFNLNYKHGIAKSTAVKTPRISVTFRSMVEENTRQLLSIHSTRTSVAAVLFDAADERVLLEKEEKIGEKFSDSYAVIYSFCQAELDKGIDILTCQPAVTVRIFGLGSGRRLKGLPLQPFKMLEVNVEDDPESRESAARFAHRNIAAWKDKKFREPKKPPVVDYFDPTGGDGKKKRKAM